MKKLIKCLASVLLPVFFAAPCIPVVAQQITISPLRFASVDSANYLLKKLLVIKSDSSAGNIPAFDIVSRLRKNDTLILAAVSENMYITVVGVDARNTYKVYQANTGPVNGHVTLPFIGGMRIDKIGTEQLVVLLSAQKLNDSLLAGLSGIEMTIDNVFAKRLSKQIGIKNILDTAAYTLSAEDTSLHIRVTASALGIIPVIFKINVQQAPDSATAGAALQGAYSTYKNFATNCNFDSALSVTDRLIYESPATAEYYFNRAELLRKKSPYLGVENSRREEALNSKQAVALSVGKPQNKLYKAALRLYTSGLAPAPLLKFSNMPLPKRPESIDGHSFGLLDGALQNGCYRPAVYLQKALAANLADTGYAFVRWLDSAVLESGRGMDYTLERANLYYELLAGSGLRAKPLIDTATADFVKIGERLAALNQPTQAELRTAVAYKTAVLHCWQGDVNSAWQYYAANTGKMDKPDEGLLTLSLSEALGAAKDYLHQVTCLTALAQQDGEDEKLYRQIVKVTKLLPQTKETAEALGKLIRIYPREYSFYLQQAAIYKALGKKAEAAASIQLADILLL